MSDDLFYCKTPSGRLGSLLLPQSIKAQVLDLVAEQKNSAFLRGRDLSARNKVLLSGTPGNGKTSLAEAIAAELQVPLLAMRYKVDSRYLNDIESRVRQALDYASMLRCVLLFDDYDAMVSNPADNSLLRQFDDLPDGVVIVVVSDQGKPAYSSLRWRFHLRFTLPEPTLERAVTLIETLADRHQVHLGMASEALALELRVLELNFAEIKEFCFSVIRRALLTCQCDNAEKLVDETLRYWQRVGA